MCPPRRPRAPRWANRRLRSQAREAQMSRERFRSLFPFPSLARVSRIVPLQYIHVRHCCWALTGYACVRALVLGNFRAAARFNERIKVSDFFFFVGKWRVGTALREGLTRAVSGGNEVDRRVAGFRGGLWVYSMGALEVLWGMFDIRSIILLKKFLDSRLISFWRISCKRNGTSIVYQKVGSLRRIKRNLTIFL